MLRAGSLPVSLMRVLEPFRPCFSAPSFTTFVMLVAGLAARPAGRTVCGMLTGAGLARVWHHSRAHRFFAAAVWSADEVGLVVLRLVIGWLVPAGAPVVVAVDDTMFRRTGRKVHAAHWGYDGSLKVPAGTQKLARGNCFVVAAVVVSLPFLDRPVALPVAARLWRKGGPAKTQLARELIDVIAARAGRAIHVVADSAYICSELRHLAPGVSKGAKIGTPAQLAAATPGRAATVTRYGKTATVTIHERRCLWPGVFRCRPVRVIAVAGRRASLALVTTDATTPAEQIITRYASRWAIEVAFSDAKNHTGAGEARNRLPAAVERTVPFALFTQSIVIIWYHLAGHHPAIARDRRDRAPWYTTKTCPAYIDMIIKLRRVLIASQFHPGVPGQPTPEEIRAVHLAWAHAGV